MGNFSGTTSVPSQSVSEQGVQSQEEEAMRGSLEVSNDFASPSKTIRRLFYAVG